MKLRKELVRVTFLLLLQLYLGHKMQPGGEFWPCAGETPEDRSRLEITDYQLRWEQGGGPKGLLRKSNGIPRLIAEEGL